MLKIEITNTDTEETVTIETDIVRIAWHNTTHADKGDPEWWYDEWESHTLEGPIADARFHAACTQYAKEHGCSEQEAITILTNPDGSRDWGMVAHLTPNWTWSRCYG